MKEVDKEEQIVLSVVLLLITLTCLGFSFWSMMTGYESLVGNIWGSAALSFVLVMMLFALNYRLRRGLMQGISAAQIVAIMALYLLVVMASFSGMFNKFYSTFMHTELINEELTQKTIALRTLKETATADLTSLEAERLRGEVTGLVEQLKFQINSPSEPGLGPKALKKLEQIQTALQLKDPIEIIPNRSTSTKELEDLGKKYEDLILNKLMNGSEAIAKLNAPEKRVYLGQLSQKIDPVLDELNKRQSELGIGSDPVSRANAVESIQKAVNTYSEVALKVKSLVKEKEFSYDKEMRVENDQIGKISHTYRSAVMHKNHWGVWISAFLAFAIDLIVPLFVFFLTPRGQKSGIRLGSLNRKQGAKVLANDF